MPTELEQMLQAIIDAQVAGGYENWTMQVSYVSDSGNVWHEEQVRHAIYFCNVIEILLDPEGLKAAYGEDQCDPSGAIGDGPRYWNERLGIDRRIWQHQAHLILDAWLSSGPEAAIRTAYSLLP